MKAIPYDFMGDGFKAMVGLLWHLSSKKIKDKIVLIEEPETNMHPGYICQLVKFLVKFSKDLNIQFFTTSHNIDFIDSFFSETLGKEEKDYLTKELQIIRMEKEKNYIIPECLDYKDSQLNMEELLIDLRGI